MNLKKTFVATCYIASSALFYACNPPEIPNEHVQVLRVSITEFNDKKPDGSSWDGGGSTIQKPDLILQLEDAAGNRLFLSDSTYLNQDNFFGDIDVLPFTFRKAIIKQDQVFYVVLYDDDFPSANEKMATAGPYKLSDFSVHKPTTINMNGDNRLEGTIRLRW